MKPILSIILPSIRTQNLMTFYESVCCSTTQNIELIVCGPYPLPTHLSELKNVKYIKDYGNLTRCFNLCLSLCEGKYVTWASDDGLYQPLALDKAINLANQFSDFKTIISMSCTEGTGCYSKEMAKINKHDAIKSAFIPNDWEFLGIAIFHRDYLLELGGINCQFEVLAMAHVDLSIRSQIDNAKIMFMDDIVLKCTHTPGETGDHGPIHRGQIEHDQPLYAQMYKYGINIESIHLQLDNWKDSPTVWHRRFSDV